MIDLHNQGPQTQGCVNQWGVDLVDKVNHRPPNL